MNKLSFAVDGRAYPLSKEGFYPQGDFIIEYKDGKCQVSNGVDSVELDCESLILQQGNKLQIMGEELSFGDVTQDALKELEHNQYTEFNKPLNECIKLMRETDIYKYKVGNKTYDWYLYKIDRIDNAYVADFISTYEGIPPLADFYAMSLSDYDHPRVRTKISDASTVDSSLVYNSNTLAAIEAKMPSVQKYIFRKIIEY